MDNFFLKAATKDSALFKYFCVAVSDAMFLLIPGSREEIFKHLQEDLVMPDDQINRVSSMLSPAAALSDPLHAIILQRLIDV